MSSGDIRVALVGATGNVGTQIAELIGQRNFPYSELKLFARHSIDRMVDAGEGSLPVAPFTSVQELSEFDIAFLAVPAAAAAQIKDAQPGPFLIDLSAAMIRPHEPIAMVAPGLTARERIAPYGRGQIFAVPHPAAQLIATILQVLGREGFAAASIMLSASAGGHQGVSELFQQSADLLNARLELADEPQIAFNVFPPADAGELSRAIAAQIRLLRGSRNQPVLDIVRVPAFHGSGVVIFLGPDAAITEWAERLRSAPGLIMVADGETLGFVDAVGQEGAITGIRWDEAGAAIWCTFDAARLAALTAVWIAETLSGKTGAD